MKGFRKLKEEIKSDLLRVIDENVPLVVETDAFGTVSAAALNQAGYLVTITIAN